MDYVTSIATGSLVEAKTMIIQTMNNLVEKKWSVLRKVIAETTFGKCDGQIDEANLMRQGRTILIRRRIRRGKLQRMVRKSAVKGFTLRRGKITRIPAAKRIRMRITQRKAARKRKGHMAQTLRKRKLSMRKRKALGIR